MNDKEIINPQEVVNVTANHFENISEQYNNKQASRKYGLKIFTRKCK